MQGLIAVGGTLLGSLVGALGTFLIQRSNYRRESQERQADARRHLYIDYLTSSHEMYVEIKAIYRRHSRSELTAEDARSELEAVSAVNTLAALEGMRLIASDEVVGAASKLWDALRSRVAVGHTLAVDERKRWQMLYWKFRHDFINAARVEGGCQGLDWSVAAARFERHEVRAATTGETLSS